ncbi:3-(3-hydroxy-phenyl)propionate hydroxylase [Novosphingobium chloroacetimidivorans]|uniref:3-(3-hydroxy-phenyl)propionate hydroxylase n=1 Tax=Novosphingobium chloroacetimidivorans TaxID=1428314 RepID=A0A7W7KDA6_9SPHN|nr:bifunctional 3-(3-hydroxy-phenyl)propionate/3-hydroxycinnamic acid hydroxylase [Novosphingobium chloroacetimidivorans]MBB4860296.1 3-(3-hydroxy-phenyl)propionate hydroxylase [Novosphingobium chloroacetimidivorans]
MQNFDVVIVGYGPTGEVLAAVLGKAGHRVAVIERWPSLFGLPRLTHIDDEGARIVQSVGDVDHALRDADPINGYTFYNGDNEVLVRIGSSSMSTCGFVRDISIYQPDIDAEIDKTVRSCPNVTRFMGYEAVGLEQDDEGATVQIIRRDEAGDGPSNLVLRGRYLVGCDGSRSFIRDAVGIGRKDYGFNESWCTIDVEKLRPLPAKFDATVQYCDPARGHMHMAIGTRRTRFELALLPGEEPEQFLTGEFAWKWIGERYGVGPSDVKIIRHIVYTFEARIAENWRHGRVFLGGDAAHTMPPYLGQGACSGMRDGLNLGWKLDLVLRGEADERLLDTYEVERKPHVTTITLNAIMLGEIANEHDPVKARARDEMLRNTPPEQPQTPDLLDGLLAEQRTPLAGKLWPQAEVTYRGASGRFDTVIGNGFVLMSTSALGAVLGPERLRRLAAIGCHLVALDDPEFEDHDGVYGAYFEKNGLAALLARPDFYLFGTVGELGAAAQLVDDLIAGLEGRVQAHSQNAEVA